MVEQVEGHEWFTWWYPMGTTVNHMAACTYHFPSSQPGTHVFIKWSFPHEKRLEIRTIFRTLLHSISLKNTRTLKILDVNQQQNRSNPIRFVGRTNTRYGIHDIRYKSRLLYQVDVCRTRLLQRVGAPQFTGLDVLIICFSYCTLPWKIFAICKSAKILSLAYD